VIWINVGAPECKNLPELNQKRSVSSVRGRLCANRRRRLAAIGKREDFLRVLYAAQMVKSE
jgi:hypothetical protein